MLTARDPALARLIRQLLAARAAGLLNSRGELLSCGGQVPKNVAGSSVSRPLTGSMGILGPICEVSLKVLPRPAASRCRSTPVPGGTAGPTRTTNSSSVRRAPSSSRGAAAGGGHATLFRARDRRAGVSTPLKATLGRVHRELKRAFDPDL